MTSKVEWSKYQKAVFDYVSSSTKHLVINARAGSGKSTVVREIVRRLPATKKIIVCSFTKSSCEELDAKIKLRNVDVRTFHQIGYRSVLGAWGGKLTIDGYRQRDMIRNILPGGRLAPKGAFGDVAKLVSMSMARLATTDQELFDIMDTYNCAPVLAQDRERYVVWAKDVLEKSKEKDGRVSFDDMVYLPIALDFSVAQYDAVVVDEAQDCNPLQIALFSKLLKPGGQLIAVGDPQQAIFGFRGSDTNTLGDLQKAFDAHQLPLSVCYRCPVKVVELAQCLVPDFEAAPGAVDGYCKTVTEGAFYKNVKPGDLVVARSNAALVACFLRLIKEGKRAAIMGKDAATELIGLINKLGSTTLPNLSRDLESYKNREVERLAAAGKDSQIEALLERMTMIDTLAEGQDTVDGLISRITELFSDEPGVGRITLSSVHKAKGLEYERVWMLESTFKISTDEGINLYYVAATRAKMALYLVQMANAKGEIPESISKMLLADKEQRSNVD